jgi:hypothetical protein
MKCPRCGYEWMAKVPNPKECPRCKGRLDYTPGVVGAPRFRMEKKEVSKGMSGRLPWVAATVVIVIAAGLAAWALSQPPVSPGPVAPAQGTITGVASGTPWSFFAAAIPENSGIENVYICDNDVGGTPVEDLLSDTSTENENLADHWLGNVPDNYLLNGSSDPIIDENQDNATIPYERDFCIVVAVKVAADETYVGNKAAAKYVAYVNPENMYVYVAWSGSLTGSENTQLTGYEYAFDNDVPWQSGASNSIGFARVNCVITNSDDGFRLPAGGNLSLDPIRLWGWA